MIAFVFFAALFLVAHAAPASPMLEADAVFDFEDFDFSSNDARAAEFRKRGAPKCANKPNVTSVEVTGPCTYTLPSSAPFRKGGKKPKTPSDLNITIPGGATACTIKITTDGPGMMTYFAGNKTGSIPTDAEMSTEDDVIGNMAFKKKGKKKVRFVGFSRATSTFKYSATPAAGASLPTVVMVHTGCIQGCHGNINLEDTSSSAEITIPPTASSFRKEGKRKMKMMCEFWITTLSTNTVNLAVSAFKVGKGDSACSKGKAAFAKSGDPFYASDTETKCGKEEAGFSVVSSNNKMNLLVTGSPRKTKFSATATVV